MSELLLIKSSPRGAESATGKLAELFVDKWHSANPHATVKTRDVGPDHVVGPNQGWVTANLTAPENRTAAQRALLTQSDEYIEELRRATHIVIAAPMYNFSVPWNLKAYIDNIVREGETFFFSPETSHGPLLPPHKKLILIYSAPGDYAPGSEMAQFDFISPYVGGVFYFIGITDYSVIFCGNRAESPELAEASLKACHDRMKNLSAVW